MIKKEKKDETPDKSKDPKYNPESAKNKDRFVVTGALVTILISQIEKGRLGKENGVGPVRIPRSNWNEIEKILDNKIENLCKQNKDIEEIVLI